METTSGLRHTAGSVKKLAPFVVFLFSFSVFLTACGGGANDDATNPSTTSTPTGSGGSSSDATRPAVTITGPVNTSSYSTSSATISLSGSASDNVGVTQVTWVNSRGGSGTASGTTSWSVSNITLQSGTNTLAVTARDAAGNNTTDTLVVTYSTSTGTPTDTTVPSVTISSPTSASTHTASSGTLSLSGSASDNVGVTQVAWSNSRGGSGTASGTTSWSVGGITLQGGSNVITVTAVDAGGNIATDTLTVTYNAGDTTAPAVSIVSPTSISPYTASGNTISLGGTASDNVGVTQVTWLNNRGGSGTASGTSNWTVTGATLQQGENIITVTARDAANNTGAISYIVYYNTTAANVYYVATTGSDATGNGSASSPWGTISYGISRMAGGDTLIVKRGTYTGTANFIHSMPSGTAGRYTTIMAEAPMEVRIQSTTSVSSNQLSVSGSYIKVDGFIYDMANSSSPDHIGNVRGTYNKITRSIFKRSGNISQWGGLLYIGGNDNLIEDVAGTGACRYCFEQGGPSSSTQRNIWRRVVGRFDYANSALPKATFATYGNNNDTSVRDHLYQNIIAIDGHNPGSLGGEQKYGAFYFPKNASYIRIQGSIVLNEGVGHSGMFAREWGVGNTASHTVVWDLNGSNANASGIRANTADHLTIGGYIPGSPYDLISAPVSSLINISILPANLLNNATGATVVKRYGVSGTLWGEPGYDQLTNENLWPWPYEDKIKAVFAEANNPPSGNSPSTNPTKRGFTADGNGLYGGPISLTSYIWEYLGTPCPTTVCLTTP